MLSVMLCGRLKTWQLVICETKACIRTVTSPFDMIAGILVRLQLMLGRT
jgi:hypothetical protein